MVKIRIKENTDTSNVITSYEDELNAMIAKANEMLSDIRKQSLQYGMSDCALKLINCRCMLDDIIKSIAFTEA